MVHVGLPRCGSHMVRWPAQMERRGTRIGYRLEQTRLVRRMRLGCGPWPFRACVVPVVLIWGEAITARNVLRGERGPRRLGGNAVLRPAARRASAMRHAPVSHRGG